MRVWWILLAAVVAKKVEVEVQWAIASSEWSPYAKEILDIESHSPGVEKVIGPLRGDANALAEQIWDKAHFGDQLTFRVLTDETESYGSIDVAKVKSQRALAAALSSLEVVVHTNKDNKPLGAVVRIPWDELKYLSASSRRIGNVVVLKPQKAPSVLQPKPVPLTGSDEPPAPQRQPSFFQKYWWLIMGSFLAVQFLMGTQQSPQEQPQQQGAPKAAAKQRAQGRRR